MIKNQAVVNEEQGDSEYWKRKYNELNARISKQQLRDGP